MLVLVWVWVGVVLVWVGVVLEAGWNLALDVSHPLTPMSLGKDIMNQRMVV